MTLKVTACSVLLVCLSGCVIQPAGIRPAYPVNHGQPPGVVHIAPAYVLPAPGFVWLHHPNHGWGWRHPDRGWHRGWR